MMAEDEKPGRIHWASWVVVVLGFLFLIAFALVPGLRLKLHDAHFRDVRKGDTSQRIVELMGKADTTVAALPDLHRYWGEETNLGVRHDQVETVLTWRVRFLTDSVTWQVGLDGDGRAICKRRSD